MNAMEALAGNLGSEVVGAHADVGRVGHASSGVGNSVSENIVGGGNTSAIGQAIGVSGIAESAIGTIGIGVSVGSIENSSISLSLGLGLSISRPLAVVSVGVSVTVSAVSVSVGIGAGITVVSVVSV